MHPNTTYIIKSVFVYVHLQIVLLKMYLKVVMKEYIIYIYVIKVHALIKTFLWFAQVLTVVCLITVGHEYS